MYSRENGDAEANRSRGGGPTNWPLEQRLSSELHSHMQRALHRARALLQQMSLAQSTMSSVSYFSTLAQFSTCELSDALIKLGVPHGGHIPDLHKVAGPSTKSTGGSKEEMRLCGPAYTVKMVLSNDSSAPRLDKHFVDTIESGSVVVIDAPPCKRSCSFSA